MVEAEASRESTLDIALFGDVSAADLERLRPVITAADGDIADIDWGSADAAVLIGVDVETAYEHIRGLDPLFPIVVVADAGSAVDAIERDPLGATIEPVNGTIPTALVRARARQLANSPGSTRRVHANEDLPRHLQRPGEFVALWGLATLTYGVGDTMTTILGIELANLTEANPLVDVVLASWGLGGLVALKIAVFGILLGISLYHSHAGDRYHYFWPPVVLILVGTALTVWNSLQIIA